MSRHLDSAAVAAGFGINPLWFLGLNPEDYALLIEVVNRAQTMRQDYERDMADYQANRIGNQIARAFRR